MAPKGAILRPKPVGQAFKDKSKPADVRMSNINAAKGENKKSNDFTILQMIYDEVEKE